MRSYVVTSSGRARSLLVEAAESVGLSAGRSGAADVALIDLPWPEVFEASRRSEARLTVLVVEPNEVEVAMASEGVDEVVVVGARLAEVVARLRRAIRRASAAEARGRTLRLLAHDINNPLTAIRLLADMLVGEFGGDENRQDMCDILEASDLAGALVESLSGYARLEDHDQKPNFATVDLTGLCGEAARRPAMSGAVFPDAPPSLPVRGDKGMLKLAIGDLFLNARRLAESGGGGFGVYPRVMDGRCVVNIEVPEVEIPPSLIGRLTEAHGGTTLREGKVQVAPTGLGYAQRVAAAHGGRIVVETLPNGIALRLSLPRAV